MFTKLSVAKHVRYAMFHLGSGGEGFGKSSRMAGFISRVEGAESLPRIFRDKLNHKLHVSNHNLEVKFHNGEDLAKLKKSGFSSTDFH